MGKKSYKRREGKKEKKKMKTYSTNRNCQMQVSIKEGRYFEFKYLLNTI
jgi:hypothetical protein